MANKAWLLMVFGLVMGGCGERQPYGSSLNDKRAELGLEIIPIAWAENNLDDHSLIWRRDLTEPIGYYKKVVRFDDKTGLMETEMDFYWSGKRFDNAIRLPEEVCVSFSWAAYREGRVTRTYSMTTVGGGFETITEDKALALLEKWGIQRPAKPLGTAP